MTQTPDKTLRAADCVETFVYPLLCHLRGMALGALLMWAVIYRDTYNYWGACQ